MRTTANGLILFLIPRKLSFCIANGKGRTDKTPVSTLWGISVLKAPKTGLRDDLMR